MVVSSFAECTVAGSPPNDLISGSNLKWRAEQLVSHHFICSFELLSGEFHTKQCKKISSPGETAYKVNSHLQEQ